MERQHAGDETLLRRLHFADRQIFSKHSVNPVGGKIANELSGHAPDFPLVSVW